MRLLKQASYFESGKLESRKPLQRKPNLLLGWAKKRKLLTQLLVWVEVSLQKSGPFLVLILYLHQVNRRKRKARESALPTNFEQSKEKNYPPTSLVTLLCIFCVLGRAHSCALCAPSGRRGESRRAGDGNPALLLLCSNWPQQPAAAPRSDFLFVKCFWQFQGSSDNEKTRIICLLKTGEKQEKPSIFNNN